MTNCELNNYIKHYLEKDKTQRAIMLTADWGTGKSYYIQNELVPFLQKKENGAHKCITVSLYGLKQTDEISKSIYLGLRENFLSSGSEKAEAGKLVAKTILRGVSSFFNIDLKASNDELNQLYQSIDLTGKLVIFEDIERSKIDILDFLGYVNNLVEQDDVKVILVANEDAIKTYEPPKKEENKDKNEHDYDILGNFISKEKKIYTSKTIEYLKAKEKTVSDTIVFNGDFIIAIKHIISKFDNETLNQFNNDDSTKEILRIMEDSKSYNLRSFLFACQKTVDIFEKINIDDAKFIKCIFYGIIAFSLKQKGPEIYSWSGTENYSLELGTELYPLFLFCFNYIAFQTFNPLNVSKAEKAYRTFYLYKSESYSYSDADLNIITQWWLHTEKILFQSIESVKKRLVLAEDIPFSCYGRLLFYLLVIEKRLGFKVDGIIKQMIKNLKGLGDRIDGESLFNISLNNQDADLKIKIESIRKQMIESLGNKPFLYKEFEYKPEQAKEFYKYVISNHVNILNNHKFAPKLDSIRLTKMFINSTPSQMDDIRGVFLETYRPASINHYLSGDKSSIDQLLSEIENCDKSKLDKVQLVQLKMFIENLNEISDKLSY